MHIDRLVLVTVNALFVAGLALGALISSDIGVAVPLPLFAFGVYYSLIA